MLCVAAIGSLVLTRRPSHVVQRLADAQLELATAAGATTPEVLFTITSCTGCHPNNFEQLVRGVKSMLKFDGTFLSGTVVVNEVLPAKSTINWTEKAATLLPGVRFVQKEGPEMHGQARSLNLILQIVRDSGVKYFVHWEESWVLTRPAIGDAIAVLEKFPDVLLVQLHPQSNITCTMDGPACVAQPDRDYMGILLRACTDHVYKLPDDKIWPLFSLHPSLTRASPELLSENFNESAQAWPFGFEIDWACSLLRKGAGFAYLNRTRAVKDPQHMASWLVFPPFVDVDVSGDGNITKAELDAWVAHLVAGWSRNSSQPRLPYVGHTSWDLGNATHLASRLSGFMNGTFLCMDSDKDGVLTKREGWLLPH